LDYEGRAHGEAVHSQERRVNGLLRRWNMEDGTQLPDYGTGPVISWMASCVTFCLLLGAALFFTNQNRFSQRLIVIEDTVWVTDVVDTVW